MKQLRAMVVVVALLAAGCLKMEQTLTLREDGSGCLELVYSLPEQTIIQVKAVEKLEQEMGRTGKGLAEKEALDPARVFFDPNEEGFRKLIAAYQPHGITLEGVKVDSWEALREVRLKVAFKNISGLAKTDIFQDCGFSLRKTVGDNYELRRQGTVDKKMEQDLKNPETVRMLEPLFGGFNVRFRVNTPRKIVSTTAGRSSLYQAEWTFDFDRDPSALAALKRQDFAIVFDGAGLDLPTMQQPVASE